MRTSVRAFLLSILTIAETISIVKLPLQDITSKSRIELPPIDIPCELTDILIRSAPVISGKNSVYHLYNPRGEFRTLNITAPKILTANATDEFISVKTWKDTLILSPVNKYTVFNVNKELECVYKESNDVFGCYESGMSANDFMLGPLSEDDYGNWVISAFFKDEQDEWAEVYQLYTISIRQIIPAIKNKVFLKPGEDFALGFAYPIKDLKSCEMTAPSSTYDRFYKRDNMKLTTCGYVVPNVTTEDSGYWSILGVGKIAYEAVVSLTVSTASLSQAQIQSNIIDGLIKK